MQRTVESSERLIFFPFYLQLISFARHFSILKPPGWEDTRTDTDFDRLERDSLIAVLQSLNLGAFLETRSLLRNIRETF